MNRDPRPTGDVGDTPDGSLDDHHDLYGEAYYRSCLSPREKDGESAPPPYRWGEAAWENLFEQIAAAVVERIGPRSVLDVGCAIGFLVKSLRDRGISAEGFDFSAWAISQAHPDVQPFCRVASITEEISQDYDLITCIEVLEHVAPGDADASVANVCRHGRAILFSSTPDDYGELTHTNVRPPDYWAGLFARHGFARDLDFDAGFISPQAVLLRPVRNWETVVRSYARHDWDMERELRAVRAHREYLSAALQRRIDAGENATAELQALLSTKTFRLTARARHLWSRRRGITGGPDTAGRVEASPGYREWVEQYDTPGASGRRVLEAAVGALETRPAFSLLMPVFNPREVHLRLAIESVLAQIYPNWELCIADDASTQNHVRSVLEEYRAKDPRVRIAYRPETGFIAEASNTALALASGDFVVLLDHDDEIPEHALACLALELNRHPDAAIIFSDEDKLDVDGRRREPHFKPGWNPELFYGQNYLSHLGSYRRDMVNEVGGFRAEFEGSQDYDLALRVSELAAPGQICHVPLVLYHWRSHPGSAAGSADRKSYAREAGVRAVADHLARTRPTADLETALGGAINRVRWSLPAPAPRVTIFVAGTEQASAQATRTIHNLTDYPNYQVRPAVGRWPFVSPDDDPGQPGGIGDGPASLALPPSDPGLASDVTRASDIFCTMAPGVSPIESSWLRELVGQLLSPGVGLVGARLESLTGEISQGPLVVTADGVVAAPFDGMDSLTTEHFQRSWLVQAVGALAPGCLVIRRSVLTEVGGMDTQLDDRSRAIDLSLRVREKGYRVVWTPWARLSVDSGVEAFADGRRLPEHLLRRYRRLLEDDPAYSPNLSLSVATPFRPAWPPRRIAPWATLEGQGAKPK
ncbi:MAG TPA: glycosyltransferase [Candidatus Dormibacteraeota bacterium]|nr:glycosyltransferase [Candidatus Dormibacteraeota bacterium]HVC38456.1 glycosyltransferase [Candidatus Dormibacteraeota bacterium]